MLRLLYCDSSSPAVARKQQATAKANASHKPAFVVLLSRPGAYALQNAGELSRPGRGWPSSTWYKVLPCRRAKKTKTAIYHPPKSGMPYLVVTVSPEGVTATAVESKEEARVLSSKKTMKVDIQEIHSVKQLHH
jgi:hypothetical protein